MDDWRYMSVSELEHRWYGYTRDSDKALMVLSEMELLSECAYEAKPSRDIRREKTLDYRKHRRPKPARRYVPEMSIAAGLIFTFLRGRS